LDLQSRSSPSRTARNALQRRFYTLSSLGKPKESTPMSKVALYCRVSTEGQEKDLTIESQVARLQEYAQKQGYEIFKEYRDDGFSGDLLARPALDRLRDDAQAGRFDRVLILSPDRLARKFI